MLPPVRAAEKFAVRRAAWSPLLIGLAFFGAVVVAGSAFLNLEINRLAAHRRVEVLSAGALLQTRLTRELDGVFFLLGGMKSFLVARGGILNRAEAESVLKTLYGSVRHIRNFSIAVGDRVEYVYPREGNERVVGLSYRNLPAQWPDVKRVIDGEAPILLGPFDLVQGGRGLVYRVALRVGGKYWGLLSVVIDSDSLLRDAFKEADTGDIVLAVRGKDARGMQGGVFWGSPDVFGRKDVEMIDIKVPGGTWVVAIGANRSVIEARGLWPFRILVWLFAAFLGFGAYAFFVQRARLTRLALFDALTGLPNRVLIEDRMNRAIGNQRRRTSAVTALLFVDLDGFKRINDRYGHRAGDAVLRAVAGRAVQAVRDVDSVGRWGGDELVVVLDNTDRNNIPELIQRVREAIEIPTEFAGEKLRVGASVGSVIVPDDGEAAVDLIRIADRRMYEDKLKRKRAADQEQPTAPQAWADSRGKSS